MKNIIRKPDGYWKIKENCCMAASYCNSRTEFRKKYSAAYKQSVKNKWLNEICLHMKILIKRIDSWSKEDCLTEALKYNSRHDFKKESGRIYNISRLNNWLDEICSHMEITCSLRQRLIYLYEFSDNYIYIGLTCNVSLRHNKHLSCDKSNIYKHIKETNLIPKLILLTDFMDYKLAKENEKKYIKIYKEKGFKLLNKNNGGGLGYGIVKWNYVNCKKEAHKYNSIIEFKNNSSGAYNACIKNKWINDFFITNNIWNYDTCKNESDKYINRNNFRLNSPSAFYYAVKNNILNDLFSNRLRKSYKDWTKEDFKTYSSKFKSKSDLRKNSSHLYYILYKNNWLNEFFSKKTI